MSRRNEKAQGMRDEQYHRLFGFTKKTMSDMVEVLREAYAAKHKRRGRHSKLEVDEMLMLSYKYWREYVTYLSLANEYGVAESTAHDIVVWVETVLIRSGKFGLPGKKNTDRRDACGHPGGRNRKSGRTPPTQTETLVFGKEEAAHH